MAFALSLLKKDPSAFAKSNVPGFHAQIPIRCSDDRRLDGS